MAIGSVGVEIYPDATGFVAKLRGQILPQADSLGRDVGRRIGDPAGREARNRIELQLQGIRAKIRVDANTADAQVQLEALKRKADSVGQSKGPGLLLTAIVGLGPALVPLAGVAAASFGALAEGAGVGLLAVKGIQNEMKAGTALGKQYTAVFAGLKSNLSGLEHIAAQGVFAGVSKGAQDLKQLMPSLAGETKQFSAYLGDAAEHVVHGLAGGFVTLRPLFDTILQGADNLASKFDDYANGGGLAKFGAWAQANLPIVAVDIGQIGEAIGRVLAASSGFGVGILQAVGGIASAINAIPMPVLEALVPLLSTGLLAFKAFSIVETIFTGARGALIAFAESERIAAFATGLLELSLGPVAITIAAVTAVGVGLYALYKHIQGSSKDSAVAIADYNEELTRQQVLQVGLNGPMMATSTTLASIADALGISTQAATQYADALGFTAAAIKNGSVNANALLRGVAGLQAAFAVASTSTDAYLKALVAFSQSGKTAADRATLLGAAITAARGSTLDLATANLTAVTTTQAVGAALKGNLASISSNGTLLGQLVKTGGDYHVLQPKLAAGSLAIAQAMTQQANNATQVATATYQNELATKGITVATKDATGIYLGYRAQLEHVLEQQGLNSTAAQKLTDKYLGTPKQVSTKIKQIGAGDVATALKNLTAALGKFSKLVATAVLDLNTNPAQTAFNAFIAQVGSTKIPVPGKGGGSNNKNNLPGGGGLPEIPGLPQGNVGNNRATGGTIYGPGTSTSDSVLARLSVGEEVINAKQAEKHRSLLKAINAGVGGFAKGGTIGVQHFATGGTAAARAAASLRQTQANIRLTVDTRGLTDLIRAIGGSRGAISGATSTLLSEIASANKAHLGSSSLVRQVSRENTQLLGEASRRDAVAARLKTATANLATVMGKFRDERFAVGSAVISGFNPSTLGTNAFGTSSVEGILADAKTQAAQAAAFAAQLKVLKSKHLSTGLLQQLGEAGVGSAGTNVATLSGASAAQIAQLNKYFTATQSAGNSAGDVVASGMYGAGIAAAQGLIKGLKSQESALQKQMNAMAASMVKAIRRALGIKSPSTVAHEIGVNFGRGLVGGLDSHQNRVKAAGAALAAAVVPAGSGGGAQGGPSFHITQMPNENGVELAERVSGRVMFAAKR